MKYKTKLTNWRKRRNQIVSMYRAKEEIKHIAKEMGISRQRVCQILKEEGFR